MDLFYSRMKQNIKLIFLVIILLFSFMSFNMAHGLVGANCHNDHEGFFMYALSRRKSKVSLKKLLKKLKVFFYKIFKLSKIISLINVKFSAFLELFNIRFSKATILHLFSFLCLCFNVGKYKQCIKYFDLIPSMAV